MRSRGVQRPLRRETLCHGGTGWARVPGTVARGARPPASGCGASARKLNTTLHSKLPRTCTTCPSPGSGHPSTGKFSNRRAKCRPPGTEQSPPPRSSASPVAGARPREPTGGPGSRTEGEGLEPGPGPGPGARGSRLQSAAGTGTWRPPRPRPLGAGEPGWAIGAAATAGVAPAATLEVCWRPGPAPQCSRVPRPTRPATAGLPQGGAKRSA